MAVYRYRNRSTGQVVEYAHRSPRLDRLSHRWELIEQPAPAVEPKRPAGPGPNGESADAPLLYGDDNGPPVGPIPPPKRATRGAWAAYALARGTPAAEVAAMTRAQLIDRYGGD